MKTANAQQNGQIADLEEVVTAQATQITTLQTTDKAQQAKLAPILVAGTVLTISGVNVRIVDGSGSTQSTLGLGNLAIGYNQERGYNDVRTGSHNLILGDLNNYSSYGGLVAGNSNTISAPYASVSGGEGNTASGSYSSVSGGWYNTASGHVSSVSGGFRNTASDYSSSVSGGYQRTAGGAYNWAAGTYSSVY